MTKDATTKKLWERPAPVLLAIGVILFSAPDFWGPALLGFSWFELPDHSSFRWLTEKIIELFGHLGEACVIAVLLGIVVDQGIKRRLIDDVVVAASLEKLGKHLPEPIRNILFEYFERVFIRPHWEIEYELARLTEFPQGVSFSTRLNGYVLNCGAKDEKFRLYYKTDSHGDNLGFGPSRLLRVQIFSDKGEPLVNISGDEGSELRLPDGAIRFTHEVLIPAGGKIRTVLEYVEYLPKSYAIPLFSATPVVAALIRIRFPKELLDVKVSTSDSDDLPFEETQWGREWTISNPLMPGQGILTQWDSKVS